MTCRLTLIFSTLFNSSPPQARGVSSLHGPHGNVPSHLCNHPGALLHLNTSDIGADSLILPMQHLLCLSHIADVATGTAHHEHQAGIDVYTNIRPDPEVPLVTLLAREYFGVAGFVPVFGGTQCSNQSNIQCPAVFVYPVTLTPHNGNVDKNLSTGSRDPSKWCDIGLCQSAECCSHLAGAGIQRVARCRRRLLLWTRNTG